MDLQYTPMLLNLCGTTITNKQKAIVKLHYYTVAIHYQDKPPQKMKCSGIHKEHRDNKNSCEFEYY